MLYSIINNITLLTNYMCLYVCMCTFTHVLLSFLPMENFKTEVFKAHETKKDKSLTHKKGEEWMEENLEICRLDWRRRKSIHSVEHPFIKHFLIFYYVPGSYVRLWGDKNYLGGRSGLVTDYIWGWVRWYEWMDESSV